MDSEDVQAWGTQLGHTPNIRQTIYSRNASFDKWTSMGADNVLTLAMHFRREAQDEDDESLKWAALERLPTFDRLRTSIRRKCEGGRVVTEHIDVRKMDLVERQMLMESLVKDADEDNEMFLQRLRNRIDNVQIELPTVEVRFENLTVDAKCHVGERALPSLWNVTKNFAQSLLAKVHLASKKQRSLTILKGVSGIIRPCRMTLLLGPPGSGKSTLLLALAGKLDPTLKKRGSITYNGHALHEFVPQKTSAYISQDDLHIGEMTVRETLDFSALSQGVGSKYDMIAELARREKESRIIPDMEIDAYMKATSLEGLNNSLQTDYTLKILGLDMCADTMIGNTMRRGVSGGQKKRVTTGEMIVGPKKTLFMDEISNGLDSSTTFHVVKSLQQFVHVLEGTILMSLLQPQPETYELFDDVILLSEGQIVYHGPRENALDFFDSCGFKCPPRKSVADFLQEVISYKDQKQYWADSTKHYKYVSAWEFAEKFQQSHIGIHLANELAQPYPRERNHRAALAFHRYSTKKMLLLQASCAREWILMKRNCFIYIVKAIQLVIVAFVTMTVFLRTRLQEDLEDGSYYMGALFFSLLVITFNGFSEISMTITRLPVFFKQRDLFFYPAWAYTLPTFIMQIPQAIVESGLWVAITYFLIGFAPEPSRFFKQYLLLFLTHQMSSSIFRLIGGVCQTMDLANTGGSIVLLLIFMLGGFIIPRGRIPQWWIWGYWVSPLAYAEAAITVNEFLAPQWNTTVDQSTIATTGLKILVERGLPTESYYYWIGIGALISFTFIFNLLLTTALSHFPAPSRSSHTISKALLDGIKGDEDDCEESLLKPAQKILLCKALLKPMPPFELQMHHMEDGTKNFHKYHPGVFQNAKVSAGLSLPFMPLSISFENVRYSVDMPKEMMVHGIQDKKLQLLQGVTGSFRPGVLTALMGVSGAGKTTLMDVLAGRKTEGYIEGDIRISGHPKLQGTFARIAGYCEQTDIHSPQVTVRESLICSAWLRLSQDIEDNERMDFVDEVMELVELDNLSDALVGLPGVSGLSTEQRKRLTIAVELVANPSIIFMDEPTSGLDARAAAIVMRAVRTTVNTGRTVVCTIHQPSIDVFEAFDELLLMKRGGQVIYAGPLGRHSQKVIEYFQAFPGVPKIKTASNPATWMLEITSSSAEQRLGIDFATLYKSSQISRHNEEVVKRLNVPDPESHDLFFQTQFCQTFYGQFKILLWRQHLTYWRSPGYNLVRFSFTLMSALIFGTLFWQLGNKIKNQEDLLIVMGAMYGAALFLGINNCSTVQPVISVERTVFYREQAAGMYSAMAYASSQLAIECPYVLAQTIVYAAIVYSMMGFEWVIYKVLWFVFTMFCTFLYFTYYGMMAVSITPNHHVAAVVASAFYALFNLFSGFLMPKPNLPQWWSWYYWLCPTSWTMSGLITSQYGDRVDRIECMGAGQRKIFLDIRSFLNHNYGFHHDFLGHVAIVLVILPIFFAFLFAFFVKHLNFQHR